MKARKKILLQLTPILDLMITILFVQTVLLQGISREAITSSEKAAEIERKLKETVSDTLKESRERSERLQQDNEKLAKERNDLQQQLDEARVGLKKAQEQQAAIAENAKHVEENFQKIAGLTKNLFNIPDDTIKSLTANMDPGQAERIGKELEQIKKDSPEKTIRALRKIDEFRRMCDFWEIRMTSDHWVIVSVNEKESGKFLVQDNHDKEHINNALENAIRQIDEPKSLVIVTLCYENPMINLLNRTRKGIEMFLERRNSLPHSKTQYKLTEWGPVTNNQEEQNRI